MVRTSPGRRYRSKAVPQPDWTRDGHALRCSRPVLRKREDGALPDALNRTLAHRLAHRPAGTRLAPPYRDSTFTTTARIPITSARTSRGGNTRPNPARARTSTITSPLQPAGWDLKASAENSRSRFPHFGHARSCVARAAL